jgi:hypothetical protein
VTHEQLTISDKTPSRFDADNLERLNTLLARVYQFMRDGEPKLLREIAFSCYCGEASASARLRELRSMGYRVDRHKVAPGLYAYTLHDKTE